MDYELYHHGILGMKWGIRRYQNKDGTLTAAGRKRYLNSDGSLTKQGLDKVKEGKQSNLRSTKRYDRFYLEGDDGKITEYVRDKYFNAIIEKSTVERSGPVTEYIEGPLENVDDSTIQKGKVFADEIASKGARHLSDILYDQVYRSADENDKRFLDENKVFAKYAFAWDYPEEAGNSFGDFQKKIESTTYDWYNDKPVTKKAEKLAKEYRKWADKVHFEWRKLSPSEQKYASKMYNKAVGDLVDLAIKDQGYMPSEITRGYFYPAIFWD